MYIALFGLRIVLLSLWYYSVHLYLNIRIKFISYHQICYPTNSSISRTIKLNNYTTDLFIGIYFIHRLPVEILIVEPRGHLGTTLQKVPKISGFEQNFYYFFPTDWGAGLLYPPPRMGRL